MTLEAKESGSSSKLVSNPLAFVDDPYAFNSQLLQARITDFKKGDKMSGEVLFYDRGIPDVLAYMNYFQQPYEDHFRKACENHRYDAVFLLPPWEDIYVSDNERLETFEEAISIHYHLRSTYEAYGYEPVLVAEGTVQERAEAILKKLNLNTAP